jgi:xylulokinase
VGTADAAAEAVAAGVVEPGDTMLMYGSTLFFIQICSSLPESSVLWPTVYLEPESYALAAGMSTTGALTRWFRDNFAGAETAAEADGGPNAYEALAEEASRVLPGSDGLLVLPYFSGERSPINDPLARGVVAGLSLSHSRAHLDRAVLEGVAYGIRQNLETMAAAGAPPKRLVAIGGGAKNALWLQIVSDVTGREQVVQATPGASYGDAILAAMGVGTLPAMSAARDWIGPGTTVAPSPADSSTYERGYRLYTELYDTTKSVIHELAAPTGPDV